MNELKSIDAWNYKIAINLYTDGTGNIPSHTLEAFQNAEKAALAASDVQVKVCVVVDKKDRTIIAESLNHSSAITQILTLQTSQRYPQIADIFTVTARTCDAGDWICYINADINIPHWFFDFLTLNLKALPLGAGVVINRKDLLDENAEFPDGIRTSEFKDHVGFDCMVFPASMVKHAKFGECTVGFPPMGALVVTNMLMLLPKVKLINDAFITWHRGDGSASDWTQSSSRSMIEKNSELAYCALDELLHGRSSVKTLTHSELFVRQYVEARKKSQRVAKGN